jgi:uncharacterized protein YcnI
MRGDFHPFTFSLYFPTMRSILTTLVVLFSGTPVLAQVGLVPTTTSPAVWERYGLRVINQTDTATVAVRVEVPSAIMFLGTEPKSGWTTEVTQLPDSGPTVVTWRGSSIKKGEYAEFPFLGRLKADSRQEDLVFPVKIERANGSSVEWRHQKGEPYAAPRVEVAGTVSVTPGAAVMLSGLSLGVAILALVVAIARGGSRRST